MPSMTSWSRSGTLLVANNAVAETTVGATFNKIEAFDTESGVNNLTVSTANNNITVDVDGMFILYLGALFESSNKVFEIFIFLNGVETTIGFEDKGDGEGNGMVTVSLSAGDIIDMRQRSTDGGTALTVVSANITLARLS